MQPIRMTLGGSLSNRHAYSFTHIDQWVSKLRISLEMVYWVLEFDDARPRVGMATIRRVIVRSPHEL